MTQAYWQITETEITCQNERLRHNACLSEPMEFMGRLAALVPKPRVNLTRIHGVFSSNSKLRKHVVPRQPVERDERRKPSVYAMTWAQRLKRVFAIDIEPLT